jgi:hypothetical protein
MKRIAPMASARHRRHSPPQADAICWSSSGSGDWWRDPPARGLQNLHTPKPSPEAEKAEEEEEEDSLDSAYVAAATYASDLQRSQCETGALCNVILDEIVRAVGRETVGSFNSEQYEDSLKEV